MSKQTLNGNNFFGQFRDNYELQSGYQYICDNNLITNFQNYQLTEQDINERKIWCLDEFYVLPDIEENIERNINIKWDLEAISQTGSCAGLSEYIFELIIYTKENANLFLNASA